VHGYYGDYNDNIPAGYDEHFKDHPDNPVLAGDDDPVDSRILKPTRAV
jgi:hypothetical protein